ncbi:MAG TPA: DinB family protein [Bryobacteraceae bacterium]|nr:DinB family protein [Bryobacteraceae bacterium]
MARIPVWFERRFEFTFPVEMLPNLLARLRGTPARLEEALRGVPREVLIAKPGGKWSAQEHAGHLVDLESLWLARIGDFVAGVPELTVADLTNRRTNEANHNGRVLEEVLAAFRTARAALLTGVDEFPAR